MKISTKMLIATIISAILSITFCTIRALVPVLENGFVPLAIISLAVFLLGYLKLVILLIKIGGNNEKSI